MRARDGASYSEHGRWRSWRRPASSCGASHSAREASPITFPPWRAVGAVSFSFMASSAIAACGIGGCGGFVATTLTLTDVLPRFDIAWPAIGNVLGILYLYFLSQTLFRNRLLDLNELVQEVVDDQRSMFAAAGVGLQFDPAPARIIISGDQTRLAQVIGNLLQNAAKFTPTGGCTTTGSR